MKLMPIIVLRIKNSLVISYIIKAMKSIKKPVIRSIIVKSLKTRLVDKENLVNVKDQLNIKEILFSLIVIYYNY